MRFSVMMVLVALSCGESSNPSDGGVDRDQRVDQHVDHEPTDQERLDGVADSGPTDSSSESMMFDSREDATSLVPPSFSPAPGTHGYGEAISLTGVDGVIYYTLDGTQPDASALRYEGALRLTTRIAGATIRAVLITDEGTSSVAEGRFELRPGMVIHFRAPDHWTTPHIHYWDTQPAGLETPWPGKPMYAEGDGWYFIQLAEQTAAKVVFSQGGSEQTGDLSWAGPEGYYDDGDWYDVHPDHFKRFQWPGGKAKALVMSMDDGNVQDRRLVALFNTYGIRGTFHLNSGRLGTTSYIAAAEVLTLYAGHEVSVHSVTHPHLSDLSLLEIEKEVGDDKAALEKLSGAPVLGIAYPFGSYNADVLKVVKQQGMIYGRVVPQTNDLRIPGDLLTWRGSCHHTGAYALGEALMRRSEPTLALLFVWGHAWELDGDTPTNSWAHMEAFCQLVSQQTDVWYATAGEVATYLLALRAVRVSLHGDSMTNGSAEVVWIRTSRGVERLAAGASVAL
ncbi:MAG: starch-binding protein [Deltaproteobacteria bacterium]|nr:starch-binding protein [Deltaproteobacteria bacterium]